MRKLKIAVIGSGISGLSCAWKLSGHHQVDLFEKNSYFGGHTNTQNIIIQGKKISVDTGFIVFNNLNYPNLCNFFKTLKVNTYKSDMSFGVSINRENLEYSGTNFLTLFAQKKNILNLRFWKMLFEILQFNRNVEKDKNEFSSYTIDDYLNVKGYSDYFKKNHIYPVAASIWSSNMDDIKKYPFSKFVDFFSNHGLLKVFNRPKWKTVVDGGQTYVKKVLKLKNINAHSNVKVNIRNMNNKIFLNVKGKKKIYDHLVLAVHADQVKDIIKLPTNQKKTFDSIKYTKNTVYLHSDNSLMPKIKKVWSSWNYLDDGEEAGNLTVTYWMNNLQSLKTKTNIFVSLNPSKPPESNKIFKIINYEHPIFDQNTFVNQKKIVKYQGQRNIWYCGAYLGYGFHEDGIRSGLSTAKKILEQIKNV